MVPGNLWDNLWVVLSLVYLIWLYAWAKKQLGNTLLAVLFAVIVVYLTFFQFPELVWLPVVFFFIAFFFSGMFEKIGKGQTEKDINKW